MEDISKKVKRKPVYQAEYCYSPELINSFSRIHLWYHCRQHPLFIKLPGLFLTSCLLWRIVRYVLEGGSAGIGEMITILLIGGFSFIMLWLGFVHPYVFRRTLCRNLEGPAGGELVVQFYQEHIRAENGLACQEYDYKTAQSCYLTPDCIYIYTSGNQAVLVPFESLKGQNPQEFQRFLLKRLSCRIENKRHIIRRKCHG